MKKLKVFLLLAVCAAMFSACAGNKIGGAASSAGADTSGEAVQTSAQSDETADAADVKTVYGEISEVIGNAIVIKEIEMPERPADGQGFQFSIPEGATEITLPNGTVVPIGEDGRPDMSGVDMSSFQIQGGMDGADSAEGGPVMSDVITSSAASPNADSPQGGPVMQFGGDGAVPGDGTAPGGGMRQIRAPERKYTGEEIEVIIPVGVPIMTRTRGENGIEEKELTLTAVKSGDIITVTYKENGTTIDTVFVSQASAGGMGGFGGMGGDTFFFRDGGGGGDKGGGQMVIIAQPMP